MPNPLSPLALRNLVHRAAARDRERRLFEDVGGVVFTRLRIRRLEEQPGVLGFAGPATHAHQMPATAQLVARKREIEMAFLQAVVRIALGIPMAAIPDHHRAAAILPLRNGAFEAVVFDGMVLDLDGEPFLSGNEARSSRDCPALHHAIELKPQVIMQPARGMLLNDEPIALSARHVTARFRGHVESAFLVIRLQTHVSIPEPPH